MQHVWLIWSLLLLSLWMLIYFWKPYLRKEMLKMSLWTMPMGLTEPLFVPEYWDPPSLFDLAHKTGFDLESLIFSFGIGGVGSVLYKLIYPIGTTQIDQTERRHRRHQIHRVVLISPLVIFFALAVFTPLNHIYCGIMAMFLAALATLYCRPDLKSKIWVGGLLFVTLYFVYFGSILLFYPDYVTLYWKLDQLTGILVAGIPLEELLFALSFGMFWSSLYEHLFWFKLVPTGIDGSGFNQQLN